MKAIRFISILALLATAFPLAVRAQDAAATRQQLIIEHCKTLDTLLDGVQRRDLVSRTNLGHEYEATGRLLGAFVQRLRNNGQATQLYDQLITQFNDATTGFREAYVHYDDSMNALKQIDCRKDPAAFDVQLAKTRGMRDTAEGTSRHASAIVGQYRDAMVQLQAALPDTSAKGAAQ